MSAKTRAIILGKWKMLFTFHIQNMANFDYIHHIISSSINLIFMKSSQSLKSKYLVGHFFHLKKIKVSCDFFISIVIWVTWACTKYVISSFYALNIKHAFNLLNINFGAVFEFFHCLHMNSLELFHITQIEVCSISF